MAQILKNLGQVNPSATTLTTLYTVPAATSSVISSIIICNQAAADATFRISVQVAAAADNAKQYLYYDTTVEANDTFIATIGMTLATTDVVKVYASTGTLSFSAFGTENT
jgi:hypothetical protein